MAWEILGSEYFGNSLWEYLLFFGIVIASVVAAKIIDYILKNIIKNLTKKTKTQFDDILLDVMDGPLVFGVFILGLFIGSAFLYLSEGARNIFHIILRILFTIDLAWFIIALIDSFIIHYIIPFTQKTETDLDDHLVPLLKKILKITVVVIVSIMILSDLGFNVTSILAGLGIGGLAFALAAQDLLKNLFGGVAIMFDKSFKIGDYIKVDTVEGTVEEVGLRTTKVRTPEGTLVTMPNSKVSDSVLNNITRRKTIKNQFIVGLVYDTSHSKLKKAIEILRDLYKNHPSTADYWVYFKEYGNSSLNILVAHWVKCKDYVQFLTINEELNLEIMKRFEKEGIEFAFPTQTIEIKKK